MLTICISILLILFLIRYLLLYVFIPLRTKWLRKGFKNNIYRKINALSLRKDIVFKNSNTEIPYLFEIGDTINPRKIIFKTSISHGKEIIGGDVNLDSASSYDVEELRAKNECIIILPILNVYGFKNFKRVNRFKNDPQRSSQYKTKHKRIIRFLKGWNTNEKIFGIRIGVIMSLLNNNWYKKPDNELFIDPMIEEFKNIVFSYAEKYDPEQIILKDFHSGNNHWKTAVWFSELGSDFTQIELEHLKNTLKKYNAVLEKIPYGTDGGVHEYIISEFKKKFNIRITGLTYEISVFDQPFSILSEKNQIRIFQIIYFYNYLTRTVFEPFLKKREKKISEGVLLVQKILKLNSSRYST